MDKIKEQEEDDETVSELQEEDRKINRRIDRSLIVALVAVAISLIGTLVSIYEARVLREQQDLLAEQKSASAWPYLQAGPNTNYAGDSVATIAYEVENKGIGPAIMGDFKYLFNGKEYTLNNIHTGIIGEVDSFLIVGRVQNSAIDSTVIQPGETVTVFTLRILPRLNREHIWIAGQIADRLSVEGCYCSVYGDCWFRGSALAPQKRSDCVSYISY